MNSTIKSRFDKRSNNINLMSMVFSILIIVFHAYPLYYGAESLNVDIITRYWRGYNLGSFIVAGFFVISGFLITFSVQNSKSSGEYLLKRVKNVVLPLVPCFVISAIFVAPKYCSLSFKEYIVHPSIYFHYIIDNLLMIKNTVYGIYDTFVGNPYPNVINGSIWTLKHQVFFYLVILIIYKMKILKKGKTILTIWGMAVMLYVLNQSGCLNGMIMIIQSKVGWIGILNESGQLIKLFSFFMTGVVLNIYSDKIICNRYTIAMCVILIVVTSYFNLIEYTAVILVPYFILTIATTKERFSIKDISYDIYIYAFMIQQIIIAQFPEIGFMLYMLLSIVTTVIVGYLSNVFVMFVRNKILERKVGK